jgi:hypothetical protein
MYQLDWTKNLKNYKKTNIKRLSTLILCIGTSFTFGNIFGISTKSFTNPYIFVFCSMCCIEYISFVKYSKKCQIVEKNFIGTTFLSTCLNAAKRGFLTGLLVEAFKVGS